METAKQKAIREAWTKIYGQEKYELIKYAISDNGLINSLKTPEISKIIDTFHNDIVWGTICYRPTSLKGIDSNNGWIKIESEDDLPKFFCSCWVIVDGVVINTPLNYNPTTKQFNYNVIFQDYKWFSHYQPIEKPKEKPIY